jgi:chromate reductase
MNVLGISGSLRQGSYNSMALRAAQKLAPEGMRIDIADIGAIPMYNFSVSGVLKNTLDWMSRPPEPPFEGKVVAIMGASGGPLGTARAQYDLRKILVYMNTFTVNKPEVFIGAAQTKFNAQGELTDETTARFIKDLLVSLQALKTRLG